MGLEVSSEFSLVALVVVASFFANMLMLSGVMDARKKYGVRYPTLYALESENKEAKLFNCVQKAILKQRGHQNFLEVVPFFFALLLTAGLQHPRVAAVTGVVFLAARVMYFRGYSSGVPAKRMKGTILSYFCIFVLIGCSISFAVHQLLF